MSFTLPPLPYSNDALMPYISPETIHYHYGKHHKTYVDTLNKLIPGTDYEKMSLEEIMKKSASGPVFNNSAQIWNHSFYWQCLKPQGGSEPTGELMSAINADFGSFQAFKEKFADTAMKTFGSGWAWLVKNKSGKLEILSTQGAGCPLTEGHTPLLTCDVWEHAYYIDYRNERAKYVETFWKMANWDFAATCMKTPWKFQ